MHSPLVSVPAPGDSPDPPPASPAPPPPSAVGTQPPYPFSVGEGETCKIPDVVLYTPSTAREVPIVATAQFNSSYVDNPCHIYKCTVYIVGIDASPTSAVQEDMHSYKWLLSPHQQGEVVISLDIEIGNSCAVYRRTSVTVFDSTSPRAVAVIERPVNHNGTTFAFYIQFSEPVQPLAADSFQIDDHSQISEVINSSRNYTRVLGSGKPGAKSRIVLLKSGYRDLAGNYGAQDLVVEVENPVHLRIAHAIKRTQIPMAMTVSGGIVVSAAASTSAATVASTASSGTTMRTNLLRSSLHLQFLAMTGNMAVPALSGTYKDLASTFSWTGIAFKSSPWTPNSGGVGAGEMEKMRCSWSCSKGASAPMPRLLIDCIAQLFRRFCRYHRGWKVTDVY